MRFKNYLLPLLVLMLLFSSNMSAQKEIDLNTQLNKFGQTIFYINQYYLDTVNNEKLIEKAIISALGQLDPHSSYISASDVKSMNEPLEGNFEGVGIEFSLVRDTLTVVNPISGGPCERVGVRAGDKIVAVNGEKIASVGITNEKVFKYLRGEKGTKVILSIVRKGFGGEITFEVVRDKIPITSMDAAYEVEPGIVYIKLSRFSANSNIEIENAIAGLKMKEIKGVILDLRGNSGGYLGTAMEIANMFLESGQTIVYTEGRKMPKMEEHSNGKGFFRKGPLAVLVDEGSASASEIVAGAIQDWDRGYILGRRSFGKGLVQQMLPLPDGSQLRLTIARYHTPSGRVIQSPYQPGDADKYYKAIYERYSKGEYFSRDSIHFPDSLKYKTMIKGRTVYGGGGIMPDFFIPADTTKYTNYYGSLLRRGILLDYMNDLSDSQRLQWQKTYTSFDKFDKEFVTDSKMTDGLIKFAEGRGVPFKQNEFEISKNEISLFMKALAARRVFGPNAYFMVINKGDDPVFQKALKIITGKEIPEAGLQL
jgi:carboxyl-terminal processing protease